jgi:hypothetical protein
MTATVVPFPGVDPSTIRPRPTSILDLPPGAKALVVTAEQDRFAVVMRPTTTDRESRVRQVFDTRREALHFARRMSASFPTLYQLVLDETPCGLASLDNILGPGPDSMGFGGRP